MNWTGGREDGGRLFEDEHTDARMRHTIPQFALIGAAIAAAGAPFAAPTPDGRLAILGLAAVAVVTAGALLFRGTITKVNRPLLYVLLVFYCVLIAVAVAATHDHATAYRILCIVPVLFTAVFFTGPVRYTMALIAPSLEHAIAGTTASYSIDDTIVRVAMFLFVAHFGAVVAEVLRESLHTSRAMQSVLEAASGEPLGSELSATGLDAAMSIARWTHGAVVLPDGGVLTIAAARPATGDLVETYQAAPRMLSDAHSTVVRVFTTKKPVFSDDITRERPPEHFMVSAGLRAVAVLPLIHHGEAIGALVLADVQCRHLDGATRARLEHVARQLGLALGSARAFREQMQVTESLRDLSARKDEFLANISHELRTPAATIKLVAHTLRANDQLTRDQIAEMYETLERRSEHLVDLIENLLAEAVAAAGSTRLSITRLDWREAIVRWTELAQLQTGRAFNVHAPEAALIGDGDAVKLERVVANLLSNAAKFSPPGSPIDVTVRACESVVEIEVADEGPGIAPDHLEHIFERFRQVDASPTRAAGGVGIGLSLARHFVEAHGGTITVRSEPGEGAVFTVRVPRAQPSSVGHQPLARQDG